MSMFSLVELLSHQFTFMPFGYKMRVEGRLEIESQYQLGTGILSGKLTLPNQTMDLIDLVPDGGEKCANGSYRCTVFRFNGFIQLSGDKYFSREFREGESVPLLFTVDFNGANLESFRERNHIFRNNGRFKHRLLSDFVGDLKSMGIREHWNYRNGFLVEGKGGRKTIDMPVEWRIENGRQLEKYERVEVVFPRRSKGELFSIGTGGRVSLEETRHILDDGRELSIPLHRLRAEIRGNWVNYSLEGKMANGRLLSRLKIFLNDHGYSLTIDRRLDSREEKLRPFIIHRHGEPLNLRGFRSMEL